MTSWYPKTDSSAHLCAHRSLKIIISGMYEHNNLNTLLSLKSISLPRLELPFHLLNAMRSLGQLKLHKPQGFMCLYKQS
jgi:hypothetical protein